MSSISSPMVHVDTTCGSLLRELQKIWDKIGEEDMERDRMLLQLEQECLNVYKKKVEAANSMLLDLQRAVVNAENEMMAACTLLGEPYMPVDSYSENLRGQLAAMGPGLEGLRKRHQERVEEFANVRQRIAIITAELANSGSPIEQYHGTPLEDDLTSRHLAELQGRLQSMEKEKEERIRLIRADAQTIWKLCQTLGENFQQVLSSIHPTLEIEVDAEGKAGNPAGSISAATLVGLGASAKALREEKRCRMQRVSELGAALVELWNLLETPPEDQQRFGHIARNIAASEINLVAENSLTLAALKEAEEEVVKLQAEKGFKMRHLVARKRTQLEEICKRSRLAPPADTALDGLVETEVEDLSGLLAKIEQQTTQAVEEEMQRRELLKEVEKWERFSQDELFLLDFEKEGALHYGNRKVGQHLQMGKAEAARNHVKKLPGVMKAIVTKAKAWEEERGSPFTLDGRILIDVIEDDMERRLQLEEDKKRQAELKQEEKRRQVEEEAKYGARNAKGPVKPPRVGMSPARAGANTLGQSPGGLTSGSRRASLGPSQLGPVNRRLSDFSEHVGSPLPPTYHRPPVATPPNSKSRPRPPAPRPELPRPAVPDNFVALPRIATPPRGASDGESNPRSPLSPVGAWREDGHNFAGGHDMDVYKTMGLTPGLGQGGSLLSIRTGRENSTPLHLLDSTPVRHLDFL